MTGTYRHLLRTRPLHPTRPSSTHQSTPLQTPDPHVSVDFSGSQPPSSRISLSGFTAPASQSSHHMLSMSRGVVVAASIAGAEVTQVCRLRRPIRIGLTSVVANGASSRSLLHPATQVRVPSCPAMPPDSGYVAVRWRTKPSLVNATSGSASPPSMRTSNLPSCEPRSMHVTSHVAAAVAFARPKRSAHASR
ncbi:hypothetical protein C8F04DRAFT_1230920 [Mycena alexandri]|uniref:Uncharacterized protein n=1 Tax=Mycena alexandri TaxID=1745969 RepID=A0AAD6T705_9AGAR|nr:hypothetical protein C8F04DRAFT_1230920 [Mycena alexandri]